MYRFDHALLCDCVTHYEILSCLSLQDMMVAAGVGRKFTDGEDRDFVLSTEDQGDEYYETTGAQTPFDQWQYTEGAVDVSPYSPQTGGRINRDARNGMGDRARDMMLDLSWNATTGALDSAYVCTEICKELYEVFYPDPMTSIGADQLDYRPNYTETSGNPIRQNIWAKPYKAFSDATSDDFMTVDSNYTAADSTHNCTCN